MTMPALEQRLDRNRWKTLPQWTQRQLAALTNELASLRRSLEQGAGDSNTFANPHASTPTPLGLNTSVEWNLQDGGRYFVQPHSETSRGLRVMTGRQMLVLPSAANACVIVDKDFH